MELGEDKATSPAPSPTGRARSQLSQLRAWSRTGFAVTGSVRRIKSLKKTLRSFSAPFLASSPNRKLSLLACSVLSFKKAPPASPGKVSTRLAPSYAAHAAGVKASTCYMSSECMAGFAASYPAWMHPCVHPGATSERHCFGRHLNIEII